VGEIIEVLIDNWPFREDQRGRVETLVHAVNVARTAAG
jgi:hypothetical protein